MEIVEVPIPQLLKGQVLVKNYYSVISSGTEAKRVSDARKGYIAKARSRQKEVKQVIDLVRSQGIKSAYGIVMNKLEALSSLGYSCSGEIIAVADDVNEFSVGDRVACGGNTAVHADFVAVPKNLCVKVDKNISLQEAAFTTIATIALQGIRQAELQVGSNCVVIGLGLIGIITMKLLEASGIRSFGVDINEDTIQRAFSDFNFNVAERNKSGLTDEIKNWSGIDGADAIIITAATNNNDPVNFAGELCRKKGKVVIVGAVPTGFERNNYYKKELDLRMSCSYGPGRYDPVYEEKGIDYPAGYVRWTEKRNMQTVADLLSERKLNFKDLVSHNFKLEEAPKAYDLIIAKKEPVWGVTIEYEKEVSREKTVILDTSFRPKTKLNVGLIGAGSFAQNIILPVLKNKVNLVGLATLTGNSALYNGRKYKFSYITTSPEELLNDTGIDTVFILNRHNFHAEHTISALKAGKNIFVEKPLAITSDELDEIELVYKSIETHKPLLLTGFNRRFAPAVIECLKKLNPSLPKAINIRINAGNLPKEHWVNDKEAGGGRIIGEACHFIDLACYLAGSEVISVNANALQDSLHLDNTLNISLKFRNGSIAGISYFSNGNRRIPKESIEVFCGETVTLINDFSSYEIITSRSRKKYKLKHSDKGHNEEINQFIEAIKKGEQSPVPFNELIHSMRITLLVLQSLKEERVIRIS
ncbi:MAG: bi-domain-containing oxidoreductase [Bacteroidales bacterium]|nr:bi-domain-containing oxidoreductase [Bacteroidales bacterium]